MSAARRRPAPRARRRHATAWSRRLAAARAAGRSRGRSSACGMPAHRSGDVPVRGGTARRHSCAHDSTPRSRSRSDAIGRRSIVNFVSTFDGVVALDRVGASGGREISGGFEPDRFVMGLLRASADAVLVGAGTVRASGTRAWTPGRVHPPRPRRTRAGAASWVLRRRRPRPWSSPLQATSTGSFDMTRPGPFVVILCRRPRARGGCTACRGPSGSRSSISATAGHVPIGSVSAFCGTAASGSSCPKAARPSSASCWRRECRRRPVPDGRPTGRRPERADAAPQPRRRRSAFSPSPRRGPASGASCAPTTTCSFDMTSATATGKECHELDRADRHHRGRPRRRTCRGGASEGRLRRLDHDRRRGAGAAVPSPTAVEGVPAGRERSREGLRPPREPSTPSSGSTCGQRSRSERSTSVRER